MDDNKDTKIDNLEKEDIELWQQMTKDVDLLPGQGYQTAAGCSEGDVKRPSASRETVIVPAPQVKKPSVAQSSEIDRRSDERLRRGQMTIEATLDLHGFNRVDGYGELNDFIRRSYARGLRCVLVITGKGRFGPGVLRQSVPEWLAEATLSPIVLKIHSAQPKHGGGGAFYVLLRRHR